MHRIAAALAIVCAWTALSVSALADSGRVLKVSGYDTELPPSAGPGRSSQQHATIVSIRETGSAMVSGGKAVEITLTSDAPFVAQNGQRLVLIIGAMHFRNYHYQHGDARTVVFTIDRSTFEGLPNGSIVKVGFGLQRGMRWDAGTLRKSIVGRY